MTQSEQWVIEQLAAQYTEALVKNSKDTVYANMERAVKKLPIIAAALDLLEALEKSRDALENYGTLSELELVKIMGIQRTAIAKTKGE